MHIVANLVMYIIMNVLTALYCTIKYLEFLIYFNFSFREHQSDLTRDAYIMLVYIKYANIMLMLAYSVKLD